MASSNSAIAIQARILYALMLRDIRTRFFGNGLGYVVAIFWPFTHIVVLLGIWLGTGRVSPLGTNTVVYLTVGVLPAICFLYMSRFIMHSVQVNLPLTNFPVVKFIDIVLARALLETAAACCVAVLMAAALFGLDLAIMPSNPGQAFAAFATTLLLGFGVGTLNGVIILKFAGWHIAYILIGIILYATSGIVFVPDALPEEIRRIVSWNPILHCVEWMREAFFDGFKSVILDKRYPIEVGITLVFVAFAIERGFRRFLRS